ncbi:Hydrogen peroxide-inducible activator [Mycobacterium marinum MB2]|nr:Hydrogen peroxide-inducible activator [Mycobacterium marinum MB2]
MTIVGGRIHDGGVQLEVTQPPVQLGDRQPGTDLRLHQRVRRAEVRQHQRRSCRGRRNGAQTQRSGDPRSHRVHLCLEGVVLGDDPLGPDHQPLTLRGEPLEAVAPIDQGDVEFTFELGDCRGQGGLRHITLLRRPGEVAFLSYRDEVLQLTEEH